MGKCFERENIFPTLSARVPLQSGSVGRPAGRERPSNSTSQTRSVPPDDEARGGPA